VRELATLATVLVALSAWSNVSSAENICRGHQLLPTPRPPSSCREVNPTLYQSPDGNLTAVVLPADPSLQATPDMESRVEIRARDGRKLASRDYASPKGANGYYVEQAQWTRDSQFFVFSLVSSGGHTPWQLPIEIFSRERKAFFKFSDIIQGNPTLTKRFVIKDAHTVIATTWTDHNFEKPRSVEVNLKDAVVKLPTGQ
jgi:hypothetical protein